MKKRVLIVGGGTAGWLTACYLARTLSADRPGGVEITLIESADIGILGVGEGTFPTIRKTLRRIGIDEAELVRRCGATFKQGAKFAHWVDEPGTGAHDHYFHAFQVTNEPSGLDLLPYWLLGLAGDTNWDEVNTPQKRVADAHRAPKLPSHPDYVGPLNYAFHFDAIALSHLLRDTAIGLGVRHLMGTVDDVLLDADGAIGSVTTREHGSLIADLYVDCTGFRAALIGKALGVPYRSVRDVLFCDSALAIQLPYAAPDAPIASYTISTAQEAGWTWDIGLSTRRGIGHVYSSAHSDDEQAEAVLRRYCGRAADGLEVRRFRFDAGYREINWHRNCVAIGLSSGFFEPLEATGIVFTEVAAVMLATLFPWGGGMETAARQYNAIMRRRYERALDFIKLHYCLTRRRDTAFWRDNADPATTPDSLHELLDRWRFRPPEAIDCDPNIDIFTEPSWQYVLYGMGWRTDMSGKAGALRYAAEARAAFAEVRRQADYAIRTLPTNRALVHHAARGSFGAPS